MPELPEVQTTVDGLNKKVKGFKIVDVWTDYNSPFHANKDNIKNPEFFTVFKKRAIGATIKNSSRRAKNILIHLSFDETILIHMKMTGHIMFGEYTLHTDNVWRPSDNSPTNPLNDPFNKYIRLVFTLENKGKKKPTRHL